MFQFLGTQGSGGTAVPYDRRNQPTAQAARSAVDTLRLRRYEEHWKFYQGVQWGFAREQGQPLVQANYCRTFVNKKASWLVGKGQIIETPIATQSTALPVLRETWRRNNELALLLTLAIAGGVTGDVVVLITYAAPEPHELAADPTAAGHIRLRFVPASSYFPEYDPLNMQKLTAVRIETEVPDTRPLATPGEPARVPYSPPQAGTLTSTRKRKYIERITARTITEGWEGDVPSERPNSLGEIPVVHWPNEVFPGEYWGLSDLDGLIDLQREFNEKMTDISDIVNYHAAPVTIITGAKVKTLERSAKNVWSGLPSDAKVFNLELGGDLGMSHRYLELVREIMFDVANVPSGSLGRTQPISNTSGAALQVAFQPLVEVTERKRALYEAGLQRINYFILRWDQVIWSKRYPSDLCRSCGGRIVRFTVRGRDGQPRIKQKCYRIDPQTLDFLHPDDVKVSVVIEHSFGKETRQLPFGRVKALWGKKHTSYWDPEPPVEREQEVAARQEAEEKQRQEEEAKNAEEQQRALSGGVQPAGGGTEPAGGAGPGRD